MEVGFEEERRRGGEWEKGWGEWQFARTGESLKIKKGNA
jgi:hypothetical protein